MTMQRMKWGELGELFDGPHATPKRRDEGPYFLNISSLKSGRLDLSESDHVNEEDFEKWTRRVTPQEGDLLFSYETRLGEAALMPAGLKACLGRRMALLRPDPRVVDPRYLLYFYLSPQFQRLIDERSIVGATVPRILLSTMSEWPIEIHPLQEQQVIVDLLGALDDKIAINRSVEACAVELSEAYFRRLLQEAEMSYTYGQISEISGGGTPSTKQFAYWNGDISWVTPTDVTSLSIPFLDVTSRRITDAGLANCSSALHPKGSILMTSRATIGAFALAMAPMATNQGFIVVQALNPRHQLWLFHEMRTRVSDYVAHANGATFLELSRGKFKDLPVAWPLEECTFDAFNDRVQPLHDRAYAAMKESRTLAALRDTLLPALMSGRLTVRDAEAAVSEVI